MEASLFIQCIITEKQSNYYCDETKKIALNSQTVRAKINPLQVEPRWAIQRQTPGSDPSMKIVSAKVVIVSEA